MGHAGLGAGGGVGEEEVGVVALEADSAFAASAVGGAGVGGVGAAVVGERVPAVATGAVGQVETLDAGARTLDAPPRRVSKETRRTGRHASSNLS